VVEGPSGIGKTTAINRALDRLGFADAAQILSARRAADREMINYLPEIQDFGIVIVDDFHKLDYAATEKIADFLKLLADEERENTKLVVIGINKAGDALIRLAEDITNRINVIRFESNPDDKVEELIRKGEDVLNVKINVSADIVEAFRGSFYITQMLCAEVCKKMAFLSRQTRY
jgi:type II secretory pathway predicted ATPase ExeA